LVKILSARKLKLASLPNDEDFLVCARGDKGNLLFIKELEQYLKAQSRRRPQKRTPPVVAEVGPWFDRNRQHGTKGYMASPVTSLIPAERIEESILLLTDQKVMLDRDLAKLYGVKPIALRQQVARNKERFPDDFMFQLKEIEARTLVSQNVIPSKRSLGGALPYVFTQEGVAMLSGVLKSKRAVQVNIGIMRAFVRLRRMIATNEELARKIKELESSSDKNFKVVFRAIFRLMKEAPESKGKMGFLPESGQKRKSR